MKAGWIDFGLVRDFLAEQINAYRICTKPEAWAERFGNEALISFRTERDRDAIIDELPQWSEAGQVHFARIFARFLPKQDAERESPQLVWGNRDADLRATVMECGVHFGIDFGGGYSAGLFVDQRHNRQFVRRIAPRKLLNCFAYTCSFSVVAGLMGASTVSIDLSRKSLARGRENFTINGMSMNRHRFLADDVFDVLPRLAGKGEKFDVIILDPPTFSRSRRGSSFQVEHDFEKLLIAALELTERDAKILLSTNCAKLNERALEVMARFGLKIARRAGSFHRTPALPDFPPGAAARSIWLTLR